MRPGQGFSAARAAQRAQILMRGFRHRPRSRFIMGGRHFIGRESHQPQPAFSMTLSSIFDVDDKLYCSLGSRLTIDECGQS